MKGGYRAGAGRKKGFAAKNAEEARRLIAEMVSEEIGPIVRALIKKAKNGDISAAKELFDRAWGKAVQAAAPAEVDIPQLIKISVMRDREKYAATEAERRGD